MTAASASFGELVASGVLTEAQAQAIAQAINASLTAALQPLTAQLQQLSAEVTAARVLASKAYNATCNEGGARPFVPVPNAAGALTPEGTPPLRDRAALVALTMEQAASWCRHYGIDPPPDSLYERKRAVAAELGALVSLE